MRTRSRRPEQALSHVAAGSSDVARLSRAFRPRLERLEDRVQPGDTVLGISAVALWGLTFTSLAAPATFDPGVHHHRWHDDLFASMDTVGAQLLADTGTGEVVSGTVGDGTGIGVTDGLAPPILASTDALAEHIAVYRLASLDRVPLQAFSANRSPQGDGVGVPWLGKLANHHRRFGLPGQPGTQPRQRHPASFCDDHRPAELC